LLLSLFCGAGGLDLGFEEAGFEIGLAFDKKLDSVTSYNHNRESKSAHCADIRSLDLAKLDELWGEKFKPEGMIGGPPCQSFSQANRTVSDEDPRHLLPLVYADLLARLNARHPLKFFVLENVPGLESSKHSETLSALEERLRLAGFVVHRKILNAYHFSTPQSRERLFLVGLNEKTIDVKMWKWPSPPAESPHTKTVKHAIGALPPPTFFDRTLSPEQIPFHRNHWCMTPKSPKFKKKGALIPGHANHRSFKTLAWEYPSLTVAYGHREVHVHPDCKRRLSVYEAMLLQGFPPNYELTGNLSSQIDQVSEAVPPKLAKAVAESVLAAIKVAKAPSPQRRRLIKKQPSAAARDEQASVARQKHRNSRKTTAPRSQ